MENQEKKTIDIDLQQERECTNLMLIIIFIAGIIIGAWLW